MKKIIQSLSDTFPNRSYSVTSPLKARNLYSHALLLMILLGVLMLPAGCKKDKDQPTSTLNAQDRAFFDSAARSNLAEITLGQLAVSKGADNSIKEFGQMMVTMHTEQTNLLKALADRKGVTLPTDLAPADRIVRDRLTALTTGPAFDSLYINSQVLGHQRTVSNFQLEINNGQDAEVKQLATTNLPIIQDHLDEATSIRASLDYD
jgi:putative membrane protein